MDLTEFLTSEGYRRIPLTRGSVGHFHAEGALNTHRVDVVLDTGAAGTVVSLTLAEALGLEVEKLPYQGGGAGSAYLDLYTVKDVELQVGGCVVRPSAVVAMDLSHVNEALARKGQGPVEVILGVDVFSAQAAVIDYGSSALFLRP